MLFDVFDFAFYTAGWDEGVLGMQLGEVARLKVIYTKLYDFIFFRGSIFNPIIRVIFYIHQVKWVKFELSVKICYTSNVTQVY